MQYVKDQKFRLYNAKPLGSRMHSLPSQTRVMDHPSLELLTVGRCIWLRRAGPVAFTFRGYGIRF